MTAPLAAGCRLEPTADLRTIDEGRILLGGSPLRVLRLSPTGAALARGWFAGEAVADRPSHHELARRLEASGMAHLRWPERDDGPVGVGPTVIIPTHDDADELARTLAGEPGRWAAEVLVVDDGSAVPVTAEPDGATTRVIRRPIAGGPGAARQTGLDATRTELVILVDAGVELDGETAAGLLRAFDDPEVVAAAPRVVSPPRADLVGRYDHHRSPLDLGPVESLVGPGRAVPYVPTACLAVRVEAVRRAGGFDPDLRYGEDVDLVWRLGQIGHVRYLPHLVVSHPARGSLPALVAQRRAYGSSAGPLAARHGSAALAPCRVSPWTLLVTALALAGRPVWAGLTAVGTGLALRPKLEPMPDAGAEAMALTLRGHWYGGLSIVTALLRSWAPALLVLAFGGRRARRLATTAAAAGAARRLLDGPRQPTSAAIDLGVGVVDDLAYGLGLWQGALDQRSTAALRPVIADWPGPGSGPSVRQRLAGAVRRVATRR